MDKDLDAIIVCATNVTHAEMTIAALKAGKDVLCEKPMATSLDEAREMMKAAKETDKLLYIAHNLRFAPAHIKAKEILHSGQLGKVITFRSVFGHPGCEFWAIDKKNTWFFKKAVAQFGCLGDLGIHKIDLMRWILEDEFVEISAFVETLNKKNSAGDLIDVEDNAPMLLKTKKGITGNIIFSWTYQKEDNSTVLYCENGVMNIYGDPDYQITIQRNDNSSDYYKIGEIPSNVKQVKSGIVDSFIDCIINKNEALVTGKDGYEALKVVFAALESSKLKKVVAIEQ